MRFRRIRERPPGACLNCHASMVTVYNQLGNGDKFRGFQIINHMKYAEARQYAKHPVACIDCRDPQKHAAKSDAVGVH